MAAIELKLDHVSKSFAKKESKSVINVLQDINASFHENEFISIVGTSGCGKSTLLRLVAGFINPTEGKIIMNGEEVTKTEPNRGMVFQKPTLFPWLTVGQNIAFSLKAQGIYKENAERVDEMLELIGLADFKDEFPARLSGGMAQRVALARTIINQPDVLLLDEPLSALDAFTRMNMQDEVLAIWKLRKQLVLMVTHDVDEAIYMGTKVVVMDKNPGRISKIIPIELDYPRDRTSKQFVDYRIEILNTLHFGNK
jgi:NitT/TauT family transport system ATP-binding protein